MTKERTRECEYKVKNHDSIAFFFQYSRSILKISIIKY